MTTLPVDEALPRLRAALAERRAAVLTAPPEASRKVSSEDAMVAGSLRSTWRKPATLVGAPRSNSMEVLVPLAFDEYSVWDLPSRMLPASWCPPG